MPVAAGPIDDNYQQIQESLVHIEQYNGTEMTSDEYLELVWPQIYAKISSEYKQRLRNINHVWELKKLPEDGTGLGFSINDKWGLERFTLMDAIETLDITEGEYQAVTQTELYLDMPDDTRKMLSGMIRVQRYIDVSNLTRSISEDETQWFSKEIFSNVTCVVIDLEWINSPNIENNLSITIYSPDRCIFGPFINPEMVDDKSQKMRIRTTITRPDGIAEGEWWCSVKGVRVNGSQEFTI